MENTTQPSPTTSSLRQYWFFFSGQLFSLLGSSVVQFALIWWLTVTSTMDPRYADSTGTILGLASVAGFAPFVLTSLFAGVFVDRWNRKYVIAIADAAQAAITAILIVMFYIGFVDIPYILAVLALRAIAQGFHNPATQAIIPIMVPREKFTRVNSLQYLFNGIINLVGPIVGATLIEIFGVDQMGTILWIDVITFAVAIIPVLVIKIPDITKEKREAKEKLSFRQEFREGIVFIRNAKGLLSLLLTFTVINIMTAPVFMLLPLIVVDERYLNAGAGTLALIFAFLNGGSIVASFLLSIWTPFKKNVNGVGIGQFFLYISVLITAYSALTGNLLGMIIAALINGVTLPLANVHSQNIWLSVVPPELQGRVMSVRQTIAWIMIPVAQMLGGVLADIFTPVQVFLGGFTLGMLFLAYAWFFTGLPIVEKTLGLEDELFPEEEPYPAASAN